MNRQQTLADLIAQIQTAQRIAIILHVSPDGDACGSAFALRLALLGCKKEVYMVCDHKVPQIYEDLEGADAVREPSALADTRFDLAIAVDVADCARMGESVAVFNAAEHTAQIDHHATNPGYAQVNYVQTPLSATGVLILDVIDALRVPLDSAIAKCLFVAVATDTGNFKQQNTDAASLRLAARCLEAGADPSQITRRVFDLRPLAQTKLLARALNSLQVFADGRVVMMALKKTDFRETGAKAEHTEGIVNFGINTQGAQIACLLSEAGEHVKGSLRALPPHDVSRVATHFGGGGHLLAAGCTMASPIEAAWDRMLAALEEEVEREK